MKNKYLAYALIVLATCTSNLMAAAATPVPPKPITIDPTLSFFTALATCAPGNYTERNDLGNEIGQAWLNQIILGEDQGMCSVILATPDGRGMSCAFPMNELIRLLDQHFLQGILDSSTNDTTKDAVQADLAWSQLKTAYCHFAPPITPH